MSSSYVHNVPGRLRIKSPSLKYMNKQCSATQEMLSLIEGVEEVRANPSIGSITVIYDKDETTGEILLRALEKGKIISRQTIKKKDPLFVDAATGAGEKAGKAILRYMVDHALKANGLSLLAAIL